MLLVKSQLLDIPFDLDELMTYALTPVPASLGTPDGYLNKTNKATMLRLLLEDICDKVVYPTDAFHVEDANALFHCLTNLAPTFGTICLQLLDVMVAKKNFFFSTDSYFKDSVKAMERLRRGVSQKYIVDGPATRKPSDFKLFLANDDNKRQLCQLLLKVWGSDEAAARLQKCGTAILVVEGRAYQLDSSGTHVSMQIQCIELICN